MAASKPEPTMKDVMDMLNTINGKMRREDRSPPPSPAARKRCKPSPSMRPSPCDPDQLPLEPLNGSWASADVIERVMYSRSQLKQRVKEMAKEISMAYAGSTEESFVVVGLMAGVYMFMADLSRDIEVPHQVDFVACSSYGLSTISSANVKIKKDLDNPIEGKDVLLVDEMCDTGRTMACLKELMIDRGAKSVKVCVLLDKHERREAEIALDYVGWKCEDEFLVGYGMDWSHRFRSLPDVSVVRKAAYQTNPSH